MGLYFNKNHNKIFIKQDMPSSEYISFDNNVFSYEISIEDSPICLLIEDIQRKESSLFDKLIQEELVLPKGPQYDLKIEE